MDGWVGGWQRPSSDSALKYTPTCAMLRLIDKIRREEKRREEKRRGRLG